eukprot:8265-Heterococcus_DN1.PRE.3
MRNRERTPTGGLTSRPTTAPAASSRQTSNQRAREPLDWRAAECSSPNNTRAHCSGRPTQDEESIQVVRVRTLLCTATVTAGACVVALRSMYAFEKYPPVHIGSPCLSTRYQRLHVANTQPSTSK